MAALRKSFLSNFKKPVDTSQICAIIQFAVASVAHLVERHLAKVEVASSSLVTRSIRHPTFGWVSFFIATHTRYLHLRALRAFKSEVR